MHCLRQVLDLIRPADVARQRIDSPVTEGRLLARSRPVRVGSTICVGQVDLADEQHRNVGWAIVTYTILDTPKGSYSVARPHGIYR